VRATPTYLLLPLFGNRALWGYLPCKSGRVPYSMQKFDPQLVQVMRNALEEVMTKVPLEYSNSSTKAYLAECILKAAAQGQTSYDQLVAAAADQIDQIQVVLSPFI
jgi:hypothetical protein